MAAAAGQGLPFDRCAVSLVPFKSPVASPEGDVFDLMHIMPLLRDKGHKNPVSGRPLHPRDLISLQFHRNSAGAYADPVTGRVFSNGATKLVAVRTTGNVFHARTIEDLCARPDNWVEPVSGAAFQPEDVIVLYDPTRPRRTMAAAEATAAAAPPPRKKQKKKKKKKAEVAEDGKDASAVPRATRLRWYAVLRKDNQAKALVRIETNLGTLRAALHCNLAPETCHNFVLLAERGYFNGMRFHRLIPEFMIQGGDPEGTGRGGASAWGEPFPDECSPALRHDARGLLSMANAGPDTNGSQFFITFEPAPHLDGKHAVFGQVIEDEEGALDRMERAVKAANVRMTSVVVEDHPYERARRAAGDEGADKKTDGGGATAVFAEGQGWLSAPRPAEGTDESRVGRYLPAAASAGGARREAVKPAMGAHKKKKKRKATGGGDWAAFG